MDDESKSLAGLFEPFRSNAVLALEVTIRREGTGFRLAVECQSSRAEHTVYGNCADGTATGTLNNLLFEAIEKATGALRERMRQPAALVRASTPVHSVADAIADRLSARERDVLCLLVAGDTNKKIAVKLGISVHTVNTHRVNIMAKTDIHNVQGLTRFAIEHGIALQNQR